MGAFEGCWTTPPFGRSSRFFAPSRPPTGVGARLVGASGFVDEVVVDDIVVSILFNHSDYRLLSRAF